MFLEISQDSLENTCARVSFLINLTVTVTVTFQLKFHIYHSCKLWTILNSILPLSCSACLLNVSKWLVNICLSKQKNNIGKSNADQQNIVVSKYLHLTLVSEINFLSRFWRWQPHRIYLLNFVILIYRGNVTVKPQYQNINDIFYVI